MGVKICIWRMYIIELLSEMVYIRRGFVFTRNPGLITNVKKTGIEPVFHHNYSFLFQEEPVSCKCSSCDDQEDKDYNKDNRKMSFIIIIFFV